MQEYETGAVRDTGGKGRMDLLPWSAIIRVSHHMEDALSHYPERNWEKGLPMHSMIDSAFRHLAKYVEGKVDEDHLCAAATNLLMAMWTEEHKKEMQDIPSRLASEALLLASEPRVGTQAAGPVGDQEKGQGSPRRLCSAYDEFWGVCNGIKEPTTCNCAGVEEHCDFYPEKREHAQHGKQGQTT